MNRRGFLGAILATGCAPAICRAEWLMKGRVLVPEAMDTAIIVGYWVGDPKYKPVPIYRRVWTRG